jgi:hypothetical protein
MRFNFHCGVEPSGDVQHTMAAVCGLGGGGGEGYGSIPQ